MKKVFWSIACGVLGLSIIYNLNVMLLIVAIPCTFVITLYMSGMSAYQACIVVLIAVVCTLFIAFVTENIMIKAIVFILVISVFASAAGYDAKLSYVRIFFSHLSGWTLLLAVIYLKSLTSTLLLLLVDIGLVWLICFLPCPNLFFWYKKERDDSRSAV